MKGEVCKVKDIPPGTQFEIDDMSGKFVIVALPNEIDTGEGTTGWGIVNLNNGEFQYGSSDWDKLTAFVPE